MSKASDKVLCRTPNQPDGGKGTNIDAWKFHAIESAVRQFLCDQADGTSGFMALIHGVADYLSAEDRAQMGSIGWFTTTVVLEMEYRGDLTATKVKGKKMLALT